MDLTVIALVLVGLLALTLALGFGIRAWQERPRRSTDGEVVDPSLFGDVTLGSRATLLQFSTEFCSRCPGVHRVLGDIAADHDGVAHLDVDLTDRADLAKRFHVLQTPTTLLLDADRVVRARFGGAPGRDVIELELAALNGEAAHA